MTTMIFQAVLGILLTAQQGAMEAKDVINLLESIQPKLQDFRCEFEGTEVVEDQKGKKALKLKDDGLARVFDGIYVWRAGGDTCLDTYHRNVITGQIRNEHLVILASKNEAQHYVRSVNERKGQVNITRPVLMNADRSGSFGKIFMLSTLKYLAFLDEMTWTLTDDVLEGRSLKVINISFKQTNLPYQRFWVDLKRGGHVLHREIYSERRELVAQTNVKLAKFHVGDTDFWMPIKGVIETHAVISEGKLIHPEQPTSIETIYINEGTLEFNQHPSTKTFTILYEPGTPISDHLRKMTYDFGRQKIGPRPTKAEAEKMLYAQLAKAERQKMELVVASTSDSLNWWPWLVGGMGVAVLVSFAALVIQRRGH